MRSMQIHESGGSTSYTTCSTRFYDEKHKIAIVMPGAIGGVKQTIEKLIKGLRLEGFYVEPIKLHGNNVVDITVSDLRNTNILRKFDSVIYTGSIPWPSHLFIDNHVKTILFVHGFVKDELLNAIKYGKLRIKMGAVYLLGLWDFFRAMNRIDVFICRCPTSCEANRIEKNYILLPEFIFSDEVKFFEEFIRKHSEEHGDDRSYSIARLITYTSYAESPRLLKPRHLEYLAKLVSKHVDRRIELSVIDPRRERGIVRMGENLIIRYVKPMPKEEFYKFIINADLFIELCIDEELRNTSIEVALLETPIAKLTHPKYINRRDYGEDDFIQEYSSKKLVERLVDYLNNIEYYKPYYAKKLKTFILKHRTWDAVKKPLIKHIKDA
jgi:hypothetical protein